MTEIHIVKVEQLAVGIRRANELLDLGIESKWLEDPRCPIAWCDLRKPGDSKAVKRWLVSDLKAFLESRRVLPGQANPQEVQ